MVQKFINLRQKNPEFVSSSLCLGNISKAWSVDNMKKTGFTSYVYDFSADYNAIAVDDIKDFHKYLTKKNEIVQKCLNLLSTFFFSINVFW